MRNIKIFPYLFIALFCFIVACSNNDEINDSPIDDKDSLELVNPDTVFNPRDVKYVVISEDSEIESIEFVPDGTCIIITNEEIEDGLSRKTHKSRVIYQVPYKYDMGANTYHLTYTDNKNAKIKDIYVFQHDEYDKINELIVNTNIGEMRIEVYREYMKALYTQIYQDMICRLWTFDGLKIYLKYEDFEFEKTYKPEELDNICEEIKSWEEVNNINVGFYEMFENPDKVDFFRFTCSGTVITYYRDYYSNDDGYVGKLAETKYWSWVDGRNGILQIYDIEEGGEPVDRFIYEMLINLNDRLGLSYFIKPNDQVMFQECIILKNAHEGSPWFDYYVSKR